MMRLSTLWRVDATIDAEGGSPVAERLLERWAHERGSAHFFRSSANFLYRFRDGGQMRFLRFTDAGERTCDAIAAEIRLIHSLEAASISVATPIPSRDGNLVETVDTDWGTFHAVAFPALEGEPFDLDELDAAGIQRWGCALGHLHAVLSASAFPRSSARPSWRDHMASILRYLPPDSAALLAEYELLTNWLAGLPMDDDTYGTIHGDFELDNLVWREDTAGILDFDDSAQMWYAADVALAVRDLFADPSKDADTGDPRFRAFVEGYREHRALDEESLAHVPRFLRFARLLEYARIVRSLDLPEWQGQADWLAALRDKLSRRAAAYRATVELRDG
jgi:Ser/Thr protein kinase RdoA (MazF antagonist)